MKMKVKSAISKCGGEISHVLSPKISLIVSDKVTNEKKTYPFNGSPAAGTRGYKILQKASELNRKANTENDIEIMARKYDIAISTCEKFLASIKDRVSIDKRCNSDGVQEFSQKESKLENLTKTIKSGLKLCKLAVRQTNAVRFFNRKTKKLQTSSSTRIEQKLLEKNFIKVEDCSRQMRPLYKSNVFRKLVFCRCSCNVFHSAHVTETKPPKTTSCHPQARMKFLNLSGHCEICDWSFHCMWTHITGEMHKENVCQSSYSKIHDLISQLPSLDNFLNKYCAETNFTDTNAGDIRVQSSNGMPIHREYEIECSQNETGKETLNPRETKAVPLCDQTDLAPLLPDQQVKLSTYNYHIFKCFFSEFLTEQMRNHLQFSHRKNDGHRANTQYHVDPLSLDGKKDILSIEEPYYKIFENLFNSLKCSNLNPVRKPETMYDVEVKCSSTENLKPDLFCSFEIQNSQKNDFQREDLKLDINDNFYHLPKLISEYTDRVWSEIIKLHSIDSSLANDTYVDNIYEIFKHVVSEKAEQKEMGKSTEIEKMVKLLSFLPTCPFNFNYFSTQKTVTDDVSRCKRSPKIEPVSDACNNSQCVKETSVMHKTKSRLNKSKMAKLEERRAAEVKNEMVMKERAMLKMNDKKKVRLKENKDVVLPECTVEKKAGMGKAKITTEAKESMEQSDESLAKYSYRNTLNTPCDQLESPNVHRKKLSLKENFCLENSTCIPADSVKQLKLEGQKQESSSVTLTGSRSKRREQKLQSSTSTDENSFSVSSVSRKTDACTDRMYSSPLAQSSRLCSYRRLDKLVIKKIEIPTVREKSSPSVCIESRKCHSLSTSEKCACAFNIALQKKAYPADFRPGDATSDFDQRRATEDRKISLDKQANVSFSGVAGKTTYQAQKAFVSPQKSVQKTIRNLKAKDTCSENWNIKLNQGMRMTLCRI